MKTSKTRHTLLLLAGAGLFTVPTAFASHVDPAHETVTPSTPFVLADAGYERVEFITENFAQVEQFRIAQAGTYALTLTDMLFPGALRKLGAAVTTAEEKLVDLFGTGSVLFDMQPGMYYLSIYAKPLTLDDPGLFGLSLQLHDGGAAAVPVPAALWLFGSGLFAVAGVIRRREMR